MIPFTKAGHFLFFYPGLGMFLFVYLLIVYYLPQPPYGL